MADSFPNLDDYLRLAKQLKRMTDKLQAVEAEMTELEKETKSKKRKFEHQSSLSYAKDEDLFVLEISDEAEETVLELFKLMDTERRGVLVADEDGTVVDEAGLIKKKMDHEFCNSG